MKGQSMYMSNDIIRAIEVFKEGGVVIFPTDTAFGIGCKMDSLVSVERVFKLRKRPLDKPFLVLVDSISMAERYVKIDKSTKDLLETYWPGPTTLIFECFEDKVPEIVRAGGSTLAVRLPEHEIMKEIISSVGVPIIAPSANIAGEKTPYEFNEVDRYLISKVDFVLSGECTYKRESTIIDTTKHPWKTVRLGAQK